MALQHLGLGGIQLRRFERMVAVVLGVATLVIATGCSAPAVDQPSGASAQVSQAQTTTPAVAAPASDGRAGWVVGGDIRLLDAAAPVILHTADGGATWTQQVSDSQGELNSVFFTDSSTGWAVGGPGVFILHTTDAGVTWKQQHVAAHVDSYLYSVFFVDARTGWAVGGGANDNVNAVIFHTTDGGESWELQQSSVGAGQGELESVFFTDANTGWAVGSVGNERVPVVLHTTDGGAHWMQQQPGVSSGRLYSAFFSDARTGCAVGTKYDGRNGFALLLRTTDGGATWTEQRTGVSGDGDLISLSFADASTGCAVGHRYSGDGGTLVLRTVDGGVTWNPQKAKSAGDMHSAFFTGSLSGWMVGTITGADGLLAHSLMLRTSDGGVTWKQQQVGVTEANLKSIFFK